jgi:hypothetical protein
MPQEAEPRARVSDAVARRFRVRRRSYGAVTLRCDLEVVSYVCLRARYLILLHAIEELQHAAHATRRAR